MMGPVIGSIIYGFLGYKMTNLVFTIVFAFQTLSISNIMPKKLNSFGESANFVLSNNERVSKIKLTDFLSQRIPSMGLFALLMGTLYSDFYAGILAVEVVKYGTPES